MFAVLRSLAELGYVGAYRVLDSQFFGVAQRRRRVFVVGYLGNWRPAAAVLFERESLRGDSPPSREAREKSSAYAPRSLGSGREIAGTLMASAAKHQWQNNQEAFSGDYHVVCPEISPCLETQVGGLRQPCTQAYAVTPALTASMKTPLGYGGKDQFVAIERPIAFGAQNSSSQGDSVSTEVTPTLDKSKTPAVMQQVAPTLTASNDPSRSPQSTEVTNQVAAVYASSMAVRRLTPTECERLQGFPDGYTDVRATTPDGPRYKALGNSMAVPVMKWIGERIQKFEKLNEST